MFLFALAPFRSYGQLNIDYYIQKARYKLYYYKYTEAMESLNVVIEHKPNNANAYYLRGIAKYNLGDFYGAEKDYSQTLEIKANFAKAYYYRGMTRIQLYNFQGAIRDFNQTLEFVTYDSELYVQRGFCKLRLERYERAIEDFNKSISRNKNAKKAYYFRAVAYENLRDTSRALQDLTKAIEIDSAYTLPYIYRGQIYHDQKQFKQALADYNQALHHNPNNTRALINRSLTYNKMNRLNDAMEDLNKVVRIEPANSLAYYNRALLRSQIGAYDKAIEDYNQVLKYNPQNILSYFNRGLVRMEKNNYVQAIRDFTLAINFYPNFAKAYINRSIAREQLQDYQGARNDKQKAQQIFASYQKNELNQINFADTSENFRRLISLQSSQDLPKHFGNLEKTIDPFEIYSMYHKNGEQANIAHTINKYLPKDDYSTIVNMLEKSFVFDFSSSSEKSPEAITEDVKKLETQLNQKSPSDPIQYEMALLKSFSKNYNGALKHINTYINHNQDQFLAYFTRANIRYKMIEYIKMLDDDSRIIQIDLDNKFIEQPISKEVTFHDYKKAINDYNKAIQLAPEFVYSYYNRANVKTQNKNFTGAIQDYDKAIFLEPKFAEAYFNRGLTYIHLQKTNKGCIDLSKAGELGIERAYTVIKLYCK